MFGFLKHAWHAIEKPFDSVGHFFKDHWKTIAVVAASAVVFVAVTALTGGLGAPALLALAAGGFSSGVTGYALGNWLDHKPITLQGALTAGVVSTVVTVATAGVGRFAAPVLQRIAVPAVDDLASSTLGQAAIRTTANAAAGSAFGTGVQATSNAIQGRPLTNGLANAALAGGVNGAIMTATPSFVPVTPVETNSDADALGLAGAVEKLAAGDGSPAPPAPTPVEPSLPAKFQNLPWKAPGGDLFGGDTPVASDVRQGQLGDCYLVATLASLADDQPGILQNIIRVTPDGHYEVDLTNPQTLQPTTTTLTSALPHQGSEPVFAKTQTSLWPAILEKAYALDNGGYDAIDGGRSPAQTLTALTGTPAKALSVTAGDEDAAWSALVASDKNDWPTVAWTDKVSPGSPAIAGHAYTFLGTKTGPNGERLVTLRNPWGSNPGKDGVLDMPLGEFVKDFHEVDWSEVHP
jgi:hypothetical protein